MIALIAEILFIVAAGNIWGGWGVVLAITGLIIIYAASFELEAHLKQHQH